jgi:predicted nucleic acid-binding protein
MILLDTNVLVALVDPRDPLRPRVERDLPRLHRAGLVVTLPVLTESLHFLPGRALREQLVDVLVTLAVRVMSPLPDLRLILSWLIRYADSAPDFTDAYLVAVTATQKRMRVWTYDHEFSTIWRRPDGSKVPLAMQG